MIALVKKRLEEVIRVGTLFLKKAKPRPLCCIFDTGSMCSFHTTSLKYVFQGVLHLEHNGYCKVT